MPNEIAEQTIEAASKPQDMFFVADEVSLNIRLHNFKEYSTYTASVVNGQGGGTRTSTYYLPGYKITFENKGAEPREYFVEFEVFKDAAKKLLARRSNKRTTTVKPGQMAEIELKLFPTEGERLGQVVIAEVQVIDPSDNKYAHRITPNWDLGAMAAAARKAAGPSVFGTLFKAALVIGVVAGGIALYKSYSDADYSKQWDGATNIGNNAWIAAGYKLDAYGMPRPATDEQKRRWADKLNEAFSINKQFLVDNKIAYRKVCETFLFAELSLYGLPWPRIGGDGAGHDVFRMNQPDIDKVKAKLATLPHRENAEACSQKFDLGF